MEWRLLMACLVFCTTSAQNVDIDNEETDGQSSRKILGSSVVTSVSVVMETGNGKHTYFSDAVGHPLSKPHIASQVASPINLLNPDRYEFYTFNDDGELVKRLMTLKEIQGIIAGGDGEASNYNSEYHAQLHHPENDVSGVVENVQNVLKEEMEAHKNPLEDHPIIDTPDVSATWNLILPAFFGGDTVTIRETPEEKYHYVSQMMPLDESTERINISSRNPDDTDENILPNLMEVISTLTETKTNENMPSTSSYTSSFTTSNTKPIPVVITTEKIKLNDVSTSPSMPKITTNLPMQTKEIEEDLKEIFAFNENKIDVSTEMNVEKLPEISRITSSTTENNNKMNYSPDITMNENKADTTIETIEYPKNTELVSMITRPTTKASEKTTTSVTFPPTTQFTHSEQISQTSATLKPVSIKEKNTETPPLTSSDINNDNFVIVTLNNNKNNNLEQDLSNETLNVKNVSQLGATKYDVISNVEQIIENGPNITDNEKVATENYNVTEEIKEILKSPDLNNSVTLASSIIDSNRISTNTENISLTTIISSTNKMTTTSLFEPTTFRKTAPTQNIAHLNTTEQKMHTFTTTPIPHLKENVVTTPIIKPITTQEIETTTTPKIKITTTPKIRITTTPKTTTTSKIKTTTTQKIETSTTPKIKITTTTIPLSVSTVKQLTTTEKNIRTESPTTLRSAETTKMLTSLIIPISTTEQFIVNRFKVPTTTSSTLSTQETTVKFKTDTVTTLKETTEKVTKPLDVNTTKKQTITTPKSTTNNINKIPLVTTTTKKPTTYKITFVTKENTTKSTTVTPKTTTPTKNSSNLPSSTTIKTAQPLTVTTKIIPTTLLPLISTTTGSINNSEPYRKTEEFLQSNKISTQGDTWKLVDTVKPPEYTSNKIPNTTVVITTTKPLLEPYQPPVKVDLSTQGNFGITGLNEDMFIFSKMYNELALKFWSALSYKDIIFDRSAVVSPFGAMSMLAMIFLGARGSTSEEMNDVLKLDDITFNPHLVFKEVTESVIARKSPSAIVRELYSDIYRGKVLEFYKERVKQFYDGHIEEVEFKKIHNVIRRRTNALISKQTKGQLPQYLEETTLSLRAPLSALSTNIFQADCSQATTEGRDGELYFIVLPSIRQRRLVPIPAAVWRTGFIAGYDPELDATAVSLGTMNQAVSTVFVMPGQQGHSAPGDVLLRLEARLLNTTYIPETWTQLLKSMLPRPGLEIQLPRFLQKSVINSTDALKRMGLKDMFNKNKADLRGINGIGHDLYFSDMIQVNEFSICGETQQMHTEIYPSMTDHLENHNEQMRNFKYVDYFEENEYDKYLSIPLPLRPRQARLPEIPRLRFDRPFLYFVRHNPTGLILHMGRFNPRLLT